MAGTKTAEAVPVAEAIRQAIEQAPVKPVEEWDEQDRHRIGSYAGLGFDLVVYRGDLMTQGIAVPALGDKVHRVNPDGTTGEPLS